MDMEKQLTGITILVYL